MAKKKGGVMKTENQVHNNKIAVAGTVYCGDSGYVVGVSDGEKISPYKELPQMAKDLLNAHGLFGLKTDR
jgi:hypothetical protein